VNFIFMLTAADRTVPDCLELMPLIGRLGLPRIGFKDIGCPPETLAALTAEIKACGAEAWLEMVELDADSTVATARFAREIGIDVLCGGTAVERILGALKGSNIRYMPFVGTPEGHPTALRGAPEQIRAQAEAAESAGAAGVDLLAFRAVDADPLALIAATRSALKGELVVAGSVDTPERMADIKAAGADAFTIGSAVFERRFAPGADLPDQLRAVMSVCAALPPRA